MVKQAVILVGGYGTRLGNLTRNTPKPYLEVLNKPFIEHIIQNLSRYGIEEVLLFSSYKSEVFVRKYHEKKIYSVKIKVMIELEPMGTGGGLLEFYDHLETKFFLINGDTYLDVDLKAVSDFSNNIESGAIICSSFQTDTRRFGSITIDENNLVTEFIEKNSKTTTQGYINAGHYLFFKNTLNHFQKDTLSIEKDIFPELKRKEELYAFKTDGFFLDIGIKESFYKSSELMKDALKKPALFLDRDGTINYDKGYTHKIEDLKFIPGIEDLVRYFNNLEYYVIVVTNQGGISKKLFTEEEMIEFNQKLRSELSDKHKCRIDHIYYCPHHPDAVLKIDRECSCRKPKNGLLRKAVDEFHIDKKKSLIVGDKKSDVIAGESIDIRGHLFNSENIFDSVMEYVEKDFYIKNGL